MQTTVFPQIVSANTIIFSCSSYSNTKKIQFKGILFEGTLIVTNAANTIRGRKLLEGEIHSRKYGIHCAKLGAVKFALISTRLD